MVSSECEMNVKHMHHTTPVTRTDRTHTTPWDKHHTQTCHSVGTSDVVNFLSGFEAPLNPKQPSSLNNLEQGPDHLRCQDSSQQSTRMQNQQGGDRNEAGVSNPFQERAAPHFFFPDPRAWIGALRLRSRFLLVFASHLTGSADLLRLRFPRPCARGPLPLFCSWPPCRHFHLDDLSPSFVRAV